MLTISDYLLFPIYFFILFAIVKKYVKKYDGTPLRKYFINTFLIHVAGSILHTMVLVYYYGFGDAIIYFMGGGFILKSVINSGQYLNVFFMQAEELSQLPSFSELSIYTTNSMYSPSSLSAVKFSGLFSLFSFNHFLINALLSGFLSFVGVWKLFCVFNDATNQRVKKWLALALIYTPTIWFWGSGAGKDSISLGLMGILIYSIYQIGVKKNKVVVNLIILLITSFFLYCIKSALLGILLISAAGYLLVYTIQKSKYFITKIFFVLIAITSFIFFLISSADSIQEALDEQAFNVASNIKSYANEESDESQGGFKAPEFTFTPAGIAGAVPQTIFSTLYRPFIWEVKKPIMLLSALESIIMFLSLMFVIMKGGVIYFFKSIFTVPSLFYCFVFCILYASIIGFTTFNFGTMVRYRLPLLPMYFYLIIGIYDRIILKPKVLKR